MSVMSPSQAICSKYRPGHMCRWKCGSIFFSHSLLLGQDPEHGPDVVPCSTTCPWLPQVLMGARGSYQFGCAHPRAQRIPCTCKAHSWQEMPLCKHLPELYNSLRTVTDGGVSAGGLAFPQAAVYLHGQAEAASVATRGACLLVTSTAQTTVWEQRITD